MHHIDTAHNAKSFPCKNEESIKFSAPTTTKKISKFAIIFRSVTELYLGPFQTSMMELLCENGQRIKVLNYFSKKARSWMFKVPYTPLSNLPSAIRKYNSPANYSLLPIIFLQRHIQNSVRQIRWSVRRLRGFLRCVQYRTEQKKSATILVKHDLKT